MNRPSLQTRSSLAADLRNARRRLAALRVEARALDSLLKEHEALLRLKRLNPQLFNYPDVPQFCLSVDDKPNIAIPAAPGIYFLWVGWTVVYVGQSINLRQRLVSSHHGFSDGCRASFIEFPSDALNFAEAFYIGILHPVRNFGSKGVAKWAK